KMMMTIAVIGVAIILTIYTIQTWNISRESQATLIHELVGRYLPTGLVHFVEVVLGFYKPLGRYLLGLALVAKHDIRGDWSFFLGRIARSGSLMYFPLAFLIKTQLPLILLILLTVFVSSRKRSFEERMVILATIVYACASL